MVLERDGRLGGRLLLRRALHVEGRPFVLPVVLREDAVVEDGDRAGEHFLAVFPDGRVEHDVVRLPLAGAAAGVDERRVLPVDGGGLPVGVVRVGVGGLGGVGLVGVQHLELEVVHQEHARVAAALADAFDLDGRGPFHVELEVAAVLRLRADVARALDGLQRAVRELPLGRLHLHRAPVGERLLGAVEEDDRVARRQAGFGGDLDGIGAVAVVDGPGVRGVGDVAVESGESRRGEAGGGSGNKQFLHEAIPWLDKTDTSILHSPPVAQPLNPDFASKRPTPFRLCGTTRRGVGAHCGTPTE